MAEHAIVLETVESVRYETLRRTCKKKFHAKENKILGRSPKADAELAASMEEVLEIYAWPYDSRYPVLCMDEQPIPLLKETRTPIRGSKKHLTRVDCGYERAGTGSIFMFCEPLAGWCQVSVRECRAIVEWAEEMEFLLRTYYKTAEKVILVCNKLNTHTMAPSTRTSSLRRYGRS